MDLVRFFLMTRNILANTLRRVATLVKGRHLMQYLATDGGTKRRLGQTK